MAEQAERSTVEILRAARERISDPDHWTQGWFARDPLGRHVTASTSEAICWCAAGSIYAEEARSHERDFDLYPHTSLDALGHLISAAKPKLVAQVNDVDGHDAVLKMFDRAIQLAEQEVAA